MSDNQSRRRFLRNLTMFGGAALIAPALAHAQDAAPAAAPAWVPIGPASSYVAGTVTRFDFPPKPDGEPVYVTANKDGSFQVLDAKCTHRGCPVGWEDGSKQFVCPCHGGIFDASGAVVSGPPPRPLHSYKTKVDNGTLYILNV